MIIDFTFLFAESRDWKRKQMGRTRGNDKSASSALRNKIIEASQSPNRLPQAAIAKQLDCTPQYVSHVIKEDEQEASNRFVDVSQTMARFRELGWKNVDIFDKLNNEAEFVDGKVSLKTLGKWATGKAKASKGHADVLTAAYIHARDFQDELPARRTRKHLAPLRPLKRRQ